MHLKFTLVVCVPCYLSALDSSYITEYKAGKILITITVFILNAGPTSLFLLIFTSLPITPGARHRSLCANFLNPEFISDFCGFRCRAHCSPHSGCIQASSC